MKRNLLSLAAGLGTAGAVAIAAIIILPAAANAGDWNNGAGSVKDYGRPAVPVPAPVPVPDYAAKWYLRADAGFAWLSAPGVSENGVAFGTADSPGAAGPTPFGTSPAWFNKDFDTSVSWGLGAGYYWSPRFRTDVTADVRSQQEIKGAGSYSYVQHGYSPAGVYGPILNGAGLNNFRIDGNYQDKTTVKGGTVLANAYYDLPRHRGFTPYLGAGVGVSINEMSRVASGTETFCDLTTAPACATSTSRATTNGSGKTHTATLAWAFMAGATYDLTQATKVDLNYRYMHIAGSHVDILVGGQNSRVAFGDYGEHQLRAGLRWNIE